MKHQNALSLFWISPEPIRKSLALIKCSIVLMMESLSLVLKTAAPAVWHDICVPLDFRNVQHVLIVYVTETLINQSHYLLLCLDYFFDLCHYWLFKDQKVQLSGDFSLLDFFLTRLRCVIGLGLIMQFHSVRLNSRAGTITQTCSRCIWTLYIHTHRLDS